MARVLLIALGVIGLFLGRGYLPIGGSMAGLFLKPGPAKIPADFPNDVPVYPNHQLQESYRRAGAFILDLTVNTDAPSVLAYYQQQFEAYGWKVSPASEEDTDDGDGQGFSATKEGRTAAVVVTSLKDNQCEVQQIVR